MLFKFKTKQVLTLPYLNIYVLRYIYEKDQMSVADINLMMSSVISWSKNKDISEDDKILLEYIGSLLKKEEEGKFNERKENFKRHGIIWQRFHRVPQGAYERVIKAFGNLN